MTRDQAIEFARAAAFAKHSDHDYLPQTLDQAYGWQPHEWVILAILDATDAENLAAAQGVDPRA